MLELANSRLDVVIALCMLGSKIKNFESTASHMVLEPILSPMWDDDLCQILIRRA